MAASVGVNLAGRTAFITGGGGVLCSRMAEVLAANGASVAVTSLHEENAAAVAERIRAAGGRAIGLSCDVTRPESIAAACDRTEKELGPISILINGAGGNAAACNTRNETLEPADITTPTPAPGTFPAIDPADSARLFGLNFLGTLNTCQHVCAGMAARGHGVILNISSMSGIRPLTKIPVYSASKAAIANLTQWMATHLAPCGIRVNAIVPGFFLTRQNQSLLTQPDGSLTPRGRKIIDHTPLRRFGAAEDLDGAMLWLVSDSAAFVTGALIPVDGGFSAFGGI